MSSVRATLTPARLTSPPVEETLAVYPSCEGGMTRTRPSFSQQQVSGSPTAQGCGVSSRAAPRQCRWMAPRAETPPAIKLADARVFRKPAVAVVRSLWTDDILAA